MIWCRLLGLRAPTDPNLLRKMVVFRGKLAKYNNFVKEQKVPGTWTDEAGIIVAATADYLGVTYHIAGDNNCNKNTENPILVVEGNKKEQNIESNVVFHIGYYQDKHFQSLEAIPGKAVPCCKIEEVVEEVGEEVVEVGQEKEVDVDMEEILDTRDSEIETLLKNKEFVLKNNLEDEKTVELSLKRIRKVKKILITAHLFKTEITEVLFDTVRGKYGVNTKAGREVRRILKKIVELGKNSPEFKEEDLPDITVVEDEE